ncbi:MAG: hypothetical protein AAFY65_04255 [Pseudomonadota bacterium]
MNKHPIGRVEDYTLPFLCMLYVVLLATLVLIWGVWGYLMALLMCSLAHVGIHRLAERLNS